jgi:magnesium-protoporphyrin O-methyltransferase
MVRILHGWSSRTRHSMLFTFAPRTRLLAAMRQVGRLFPSANRAPWIEPVAEASLRQRAAQQIPHWTLSRTQRVASGFYTSQAMEVVRP